MIKRNVLTAMIVGSLAISLAAMSINHPLSSTTVWAATVIAVLGWVGFLYFQAGGLTTDSGE